MFKADGSRSSVVAQLFYSTQRSCVNDEKAGSSPAFWLSTWLLWSPDTCPVQDMRLNLLYCFEACREEERPAVVIISNSKILNFSCFQTKCICMSCAILANKINIQIWWIFFFLTTASEYLYIRCLTTQKIHSSAVLEDVSLQWHQQANCPIYSQPKTSTLLFNIWGSCMF